MNISLPDSIKQSCLEISKGWTSRISLGGLYFTNFDAKTSGWVEWSWNNVNIIV